jgi:hypothetical protein
MCPSKHDAMCPSEHTAMCPSEHNAMSPSQHGAGIKLELKENISSHIWVHSSNPYPKGEQNGAAGPKHAS